MCAPYVRRIVTLLLQLSSIRGRQWHIQPCCAVSAEVRSHTCCCVLKRTVWKSHACCWQGLYEGLDWMVAQMAKAQRA